MIDLSRPLELNDGTPVKLKREAQTQIHVCPLKDYKGPSGFTWRANGTMTFHASNLSHIVYPDIKLRNVQVDLSKPLEMSDGTPVVYLRTNHDIVVTPEAGHVFETPTYKYTAGAGIGIDQDTFKHVCSDTYLRNRAMNNSSFKVGEIYPTSRAGWDANVLAEVRKSNGVTLLVGFIQQGIGSSNLVVPYIWSEDGNSSAPVPNAYSGIKLQPRKAPGQVEFETLNGSQKDAIKQVVRAVTNVAQARAAIVGISGLSSTSSKLVLDYVKSL